MGEQERNDTIRESMLAVLEESKAGDTRSIAPDEAPQEDIQAGDDAQAESQTPAPEAEESHQETVLTAPEDWSQDHRDHFETLDDSTKEVLLNMNKDFQSDYTHKTEELAGQRKRYAGVDQLLDTYQKFYPGMDRETYEATLIQTIPSVMNGYVALQNDPLGTIRKLAQAYGVEEKLSDELNGLDFNDPNRDLQNRVTTLEAEKSQLQNQTQSTVGNQIVNDFANERSDDGAIKHPHFNDQSVKSAMAGLMTANASLTMEDAYQKAIWATDSRESLLKSERAKWQQEADDKRKGNVKGARKQASQTSTKGKGSTQTVPKGEEFPTDIASGLRQTLEEMQEE